MHEHPDLVKSTGSTGVLSKRPNQGVRLHFRLTFDGLTRNTRNAHSSRFADGATLVRSWARQNRDNPLHRRGDRIERMVINLAVLVFAAIVPLAIYLASSVYSAVQADEHRQTETKSRVDATLTSDAHAAPIPGDATGRKFVAEARWTVKSGQTLHGVVNAEYDSKTGDTIPVWIDSSGKATTAPETSADAEVTAGLTVVGVIVVSALVIGGAVLMVRSRLDQARMSQWELEWELIEPIWTGRSKSA